MEQIWTCECNGEILLATTVSVPENLQERISQKSTDELTQMFYEADNWIPEALTFAEAELRRRGCIVPILQPKPKRTRGAFSFNGVGTTFYGERDFQNDGSYVTTEWVVFLYVPLFPVSSVRVRPEGRDDNYIGPGVGVTENYSVLKRSFPDPKQVCCIYGYIALLVAWFAALLAVGGFFRLFETTLGFWIFLVLCAAPVPLPWILRKRARRNLRL